MIYLELLLGFLKVGLFTFGGGYGAIPLIRDVVQSYGWLDEEMLTYMIAVSESTPGPIMVNLATYIGSSQAGLLGAVIATASVVLPSFIIILLITALLKTAVKNKYVQAVLRGLKPCVTDPESPWCNDSTTVVPEAASLRADHPVRLPISTDPMREKNCIG